MKKHFSLRSLTLSLIALTLLAAIVIITTTNSKAAPTLTTKLSGRILLQVEDHGKAWYVSPDNNNQRIHLGSPAEAFCLMKTLGLGISNNDLNNYLDNKFPVRLAGKILLAVEQHGEAYYINPLDLKGYYLGQPADAFQIMKTLALGITTANLNTISVLDNTEILAKCNIKPQEEQLQPEEDRVTNISLVTNPVAPMSNFSHIVSVSATIANPDNITIKERGLLYDFTTSPNISLTPTIENNNQKIVSEFSSLSDTYTLDINNLTPGSYPFIRSYAITSDNQIIYGNTIIIKSISNSSLPSLPVSSSSPSPTVPEEPEEPEEPAWTTCGTPFTDTRDNNVYNTVDIGGQCWFQENLKYLPEVHSSSTFASLGASSSPAYGVYGYDGNNIDDAKLYKYSYNDENINMYENFGVLYNWYAAMDGTTTEEAQGICPDGWHIPSDAKYTALTYWLVLVNDGEVISGEEGDALKASSSTTPIFWDGNNSSGFTALPAGGRYDDGDFFELGVFAGLWSSSEFDSGDSWGRYLDSVNSEVIRDVVNQANGLSVRCLRTK